MRRQSKSILFFLMSFMIADAQASQVQKQPDAKVVYGDDDRIDYYQVPSFQDRELMESTVAFVMNDAFESVNDHQTRLKSRSLASYLSLCPGEAFGSQPTAAFCTGFLVRDNLVATAGHCVSVRDCSSKSVVFGFHFKALNEDPTVVENENIYRCTEVIANELTGAQDYALIRLDRPVKGFKPLILANKSANPGQSVFVVGHPSGIPAKLASAAEVRLTTQGYFKANLDTFGGNSGSPVFDAESRQVLGILVRGERDYKYDGVKQCNRVNKCPSTGCSGEDVTHIEYINKLLSK